LRCQRNSLPATSPPAALLLLLLRPALLLLLLLQCGQDLVNPHLHDRLACLGALEEVMFLVAALLLGVGMGGTGGMEPATQAVAVK
jgi:hypothetical protein